MNTTRHLPVIVAFGALALACAAHAETPLSLGVHAGSTGLGIDGQYKINALLDVRIAGDSLSYSRSFSSNDLRYSGRATWSTAGAFGDLHPFSNGFLVSGGAYFGNRKVTLSATPANNVVVNGVTLAPVQVGQLLGEGRLSSTAPFGGIGWDTTQRSNGGLGFKAMLGIAFSGDPGISLTATGAAANNPQIQSTIQNYIQTQQQQVQSDARILKTYPVVTVGLAYRF